MSTIKVSTALPKRVIKSLREEGATIREDCEIIVVEVLEQEAIAVYDRFLRSETQVDPILNPNFGNPAAHYVPLNVQLEVYQLLQTYQGLMAPDLAVGAPIPIIAPVNALVIPFGGGFQYHHAQIAIQSVMGQIENTDLGFNLVGLNNVPSAQTICDLSIIYSNCVVVRRIRKK